MAGKNLGLFKGLLTVLILSILVFVSIYFFFPNISIKYFGIAFDKERAIEDSVASLLYKASYFTDEEKAKFDEYLSSDEGKEFVKRISKAVEEGSESLSSFFSSETFYSFRDKAQSILSEDSLKKLGQNIEETTSTLLNSLK